MTPRYAHLPRVHTLRLSALNMTEEDGEHLARALRAGQLPALRALHLDRNALSLVAAAVVEAWAGPSRRRAGGAGPHYLELGYNMEIGNAALERILVALAAPAARALQYLGMGYVGWDEEGESHPLMDRLIHDTLPNVAASLEELVLECNEIGLPAMRALAECCSYVSLPRLHTLDLSDNIPTRPLTQSLEKTFRRHVPGIKVVDICCGM